MIIDENTKIIGRFHTKVSPRGLNIYNPFFQESKINAVYLLFYNEDPKVLISGLRSLNLSCAVTAGFESNENLPGLLDEIDDTAKFVGKIGYITNEEGKLVGHAQGGLGMLRTIKMVSGLENKKIVIVGAGNIARGLLFNIEKEKIDCTVTIVNRDMDKANLLKERFGFVEETLPFQDIEKPTGDIFVNLTDIGGKIQDYSFSEAMLSKFLGIVDVTFETEETNLIKTAKKLNKRYVTGWDMFTNQGLIILEDIFHQKFDFNTFKKHVVSGLSEIVK